MPDSIVGVEKEAVLAARRSLVTVEEVVDDLGPRSYNACVPHEGEGQPQGKAHRGGPQVQRRSAWMG
jgi:hypothetical protein